VGPRDIALKVFDVEHRTLMELVSLGGDKSYDDVFWYRDGSAVVAQRWVEDEGAGIYPIEVHKVSRAVFHPPRRPYRPLILPQYKVPSRAVQQSIFDDFDGGGGQKVRCECEPFDEYDVPVSFTAAWRLRRRAAPRGRPAPPSHPQPLPPRPSDSGLGTTCCRTRNAGSQKKSTTGGT